MGNASIHNLAFFMFLFLVASGLTHQALAKGDQCKVNSDCIKFCKYRGPCPTLCLGGICFCNCPSRKLLGVDDLN
ncbi:hypothetical protein VNO77_44773 [Canavalia gladiata]|uniref:Uncharacterized protein n=1 Tax=Canavalia gladiata TaxID=3824 RepID=A0AAN9PQR2_CANGL